MEIRRLHVPDSHLSDHPAAIEITARGISNGVGGDTQKGFICLRCLDDFRRAANRLQERLANSSETVPNESDDTIFIKTDYKVVKLAISDIRYVEGMSEYLKIHLTSQPKPVVTLLSMKKMEEYLPSYFMRIHRSYIINLKMIREVNKNRVIMDSDTYLPIGDNYKEAFNDYLSQKFLGK